MRAVLFEGTPEEFAKVEAMFRAGADRALQIGSIVLPQSRPKIWPELGEEHCYQLAKRVVERAPASLVEALGALAEAQNLHGEQTIEDWASYANRLPEELLWESVTPSPEPQASCRAQRSGPVLGTRRSPRPCILKRWRDPGFLRR